MPLEFDYKLTGAGWAESNISDGSQDLEMRVSYLSDALAHLTKALVCLLYGGEKAEVFFMDEPGEHRWLLRKRGDNLLLIQIDWFDDWLSWGLVKMDSGQVVFTTETNLLDFAATVKSVLERILNKHGTEGYKREWVEHKFPLKDYRLLKGLINRAVS